MGQANTAIFPRCWQEVLMQHTFSLVHLFTVSARPQCEFRFAKLYEGLKHVTATVSFSS